MTRTANIVIITSMQSPPSFTSTLMTWPSRSTTLLSCVAPKDRPPLPPCTEKPESSRLAVNVPLESWLCFETSSMLNTTRSCRFTCQPVAAFSKTPNHAGAALFGPQMCSGAGASLAPRCCEGSGPIEACGYCELFVVETSSQDPADISCAAPPRPLDKPSVAPPPTPLLPGAPLLRFGAIFACSRGSPLGPRISMGVALARSIFTSFTEIENMPVPGGTMSEGQSALLVAGVGSDGGGEPSCLAEPRLKLAEDTRLCWVNKAPEPRALDGSLCVGRLSFEATPSAAKPPRFPSGALHLEQNVLSRPTLIPQLGQRSSWSGPSMNSNIKQETTYMAATEAVIAMITTRGIGRLRTCVELSSRLKSDMAAATVVTPEASSASRLPKRSEASSLPANRSAATLKRSSGDRSKSLPQLLRHTWIQVSTVGPLAGLVFSVVGTTAGDGGNASARILGATALVAKPSNSCQRRWSALSSPPTSNSAF
mmetsp:Transcript_120888/g.341836  ORF Transcript_120888/g.341836 Transcript_120888/m.341836 type:complete len:482 (+) Transcript_120888:151-1596(+)